MQCSHQSAEYLQRTAPFPCSLCGGWVDRDGIVMDRETTVSRYPAMAAVIAQDPLAVDRRAPAQPSATAAPTEALKCLWCMGSGQEKHGRRCQQCKGTGQVLLSSNQTWRRFQLAGHMMHLSAMLVRTLILAVVALAILVGIVYLLVH